VVPPQVLIGTIDLVYKRPDEWRILDYKTDTAATPDDLTSRYQRQIEAYAEAWRSLTGVSVSAEVIRTRKP
jgi:ATP-dependent exoDNAse (exonuclease V) beta subunit